MDGSDPGRTRGPWGWALALLATTIAAMLAVSPWDLEFSLDVMDPESPFGYLVQTWGTRPASVLIVAAGAILAHAPWRRRYPLAARAFAAMVLQFALQSGLATNLLKVASGRLRPVHLGPDGEGFRPFWDLAPGLGDFSFPSGHAATAAVLAPVAVVLWQAGRRRAAVVVALAGAAWAGAVACGRVRYGAHFATDVLFSLGLALALAPLAARWGGTALAAIERRWPGRGA